MTMENEGKAVEKNYRKMLYKDYADSFKNDTGQFDYGAADRWKPCLKYYLRNWLPAEKDASIIDLGCGEGRILYLLRQMGYTNIEGVDISDSQLKIAQQVSDRVVKADVLEYLSSTTKKYDLIVSFDLIEHLKKHEVLEFLDLCKARLSSNGRLILQTPNASSPFFGDVRYGDFTHEVCFTPVLLSQLMCRAGFGNTDVRELCPVPRGYSIKSTIRYTAWLFIRSFFCFIATIETGGCGKHIFTRVFLISANS